MDAAQHNVYLVCMFLRPLWPRIFCIYCTLDADYNPRVTRRESAQSDQKANVVSMFATDWSCHAHKKKKKKSVC